MARDLARPFSPCRGNGNPEPTPLAATGNAGRRGNQRGLTDEENLRGVPEWDKSVRTD